MDPELVFIVNNLVVPLAAMGTGIILGSKALGVVKHYIDRKAGGSEGNAALAAEVAELRSRLDDIEQTGLRIDEVEDRLDFAERLLTKGRESEGLSR